jgi:hypothetical protein
MDTRGNRPNWLNKTLLHQESRRPPVLSSPGSQDSPVYSSPGSQDSPVYSSLPSLLDIREVFYSDFNEHIRIFLGTIIDEMGYFNSEKMYLLLERYVDVDINFLTKSV